MAKPRRKMGHAAGEDHQVGRIGNRQHKTRRIGNEGADEQIRQRRRACGPGRGINRGRENDGGRVVRQQHRDHGADRVNQRKQPLRRAARKRHGERRKPIEDAFLARHLGNQHHAGEEAVNVEALADAGPGVGPRQQTKRDQQDGAGHRPDRFRQAKRPRNDAGRRHGGNAPSRDSTSVYGHGYRACSRSADAAIANVANPPAAAPPAPSRRRSAPRGRHWSRGNRCARRCGASS